MSVRRLRSALVVATLAVVAALAADARAAAPRYILVSGPGLERPVVLGDWGENLAFLVDLIPARRPSPGWRSEHRPRYRLALFWGVPSKPVPTDPGEAGQVGWFYPAAKSRRAVVVLGVSGQEGPRIATAKVLRILERHGIPTRAP
jgi:hypothetical protein